jgi:hypothetical protein
VDAHFVAGLCSLLVARNSERLVVPIEWSEPDHN